jgi:WD40 repeat protein
VLAAAFSPDGKMLATGCQDSKARLWDVPTGQRIALPIKQRRPLTKVAFSPDGKQLLTETEGFVMKWDLPRPAARRPLRSPFNVRALAFSKDGRWAVTGDEHHRAQIWDFASGQAVGPPLEHPGPVWTVAFHPDGKQVATGCADGKARLWKVPSGRSLPVTFPHLGQVRTAAGLSWRQLVFNPEGTLLVTFPSPRTGQVWDVATGKPLGSPLEHRSFIFCVAFRPDGKVVVSGGLDGQSADEQRTRLWEVPSGRPLGEPQPQRAAVRAIAFSPDGKHYLVGSGTSARLCDAQTGKAIGLPLYHDSYIFSVAFSPDGKTVATASKEARLWSVPGGKALGPPLTHTSNVYAVAFGPEGKTLVTVSEDRPPQWWPVPTPVTGSPRQILLWAEVITGTTIDETGAVRYLLGTWNERRDQLTAAGGPPLP